MDIFNKDGKLYIFENFRVDNTLPKFNVHKSRKQKFGLQSSDGESLGDVEYDDADSKEDSGMLWHEARADNPLRMEQLGMSDNRGLDQYPRIYPGLYGFFQLLYYKLKNWILNKKPTISIIDFFKNVHLSMEELKVVEDRAKGYEKMMLDAKASGQIALMEKMMANISVYKIESQLVAIKQTKFLSEDNLVKFVKQAKKGVRLDYTQNFMRPIPQELRSIKVNCDQKGIFDNYVILHYDPNSKSYAETEAEKAIKRDPILFGIMLGSRKLYVIGDWVDELCNLTLDEIASTIGKEAIEEIK